MSCAPIAISLSFLARYAIFTREDTCCYGVFLCKHALLYVKLARSGPFLGCIGLVSCSNERKWILVHTYFCHLLYILIQYYSQCVPRPIHLIFEAFATCAMTLLLTQKGELGKICYRFTPASSEVSARWGCSTCHSLSRHIKCHCNPHYIILFFIPWLTCA